MNKNYKYASIEKSSAPFLIRFGFVQVNTEWVTKNVGIFVIIVSQLQLLSISFMSGIRFLPDDFPELRRSCFNIFKFITLSDALDFQQYSLWSIIIYLYVFGQTLHIMLEALYLIGKLFFRQRIPSFIQNDWGLINLIRPYIEFFPIHFITISIFKLYLDGKLQAFETEGRNIFLYATSIFIFLMNAAMTFSLVRLFSVHIKTSMYLSAKSTRLQELEYSQKFIIPILWVLHTPDQQWLEYFILSLNFAYCLAKDLWFFKNLPYFRIPVLKLVSICHSINTTAAFTFLFARIFAKSSIVTGFSMAFFTTAILAVFAIKIYSSALYSIMGKVYNSRAIVLEEPMIVHKETLYKHWAREHKFRSENARKLDEKYFYVNVINKQLEMNSCMIAEEDRIQYYKSFGTLLQLGVAKYPKSHLLKLFLADHYVNHEGTYLLANNIISQIKNSNPSLSVQITMSWIVLNLQQKLYQKYTDKDDEKGAAERLNVSEFISMNHMSYKLRLKIIEQIKCQIKFYNNILSNEPCMQFLNKQSLNNMKLHNEVETLWKTLEKNIHPLFKSPFFLYNTYQSMINHSIKAEEYLEMYYKTKFKYQKLLEADELTENTMFHQEVIQVRMCGSKDKLGRIIDVSQNVNKILGYERDFLIGKNVKTLLPPYFQERHDEYLVKHYNTGKTSISNQTVNVSAQHQQGYLIPSYLHVKMNPMVEQGISFVGLIKPIKENLNVLYVRPNGLIEAYCQSIANDLKLVNEEDHDHKNIKITTICPSFKMINDAFNRRALKLMQEKNKKAMEDLQQEYENKAKFFESIEKKDLDLGQDIKQLEQLKKLQETFSKRSLAIQKMNIRKAVGLRQHEDALAENQTGSLELNKAKNSSSSNHSGTIKFANGNKPTNTEETPQLGKDFTQRRALYKNSRKHSGLQGYHQDSSSSSEKIAEMLEKYNTNRISDGSNSNNTFSQSSIGFSMAAIRPDILSDENANAICEQYIAGSKLTFYSYTRINEQGSSSPQKGNIRGTSMHKFQSVSTLSNYVALGDEELIPIKSFTYDIKVLLIVDADSFLKILRMTKLSEQEIMVERFKKTGTICVVTEKELTQRRSTLGQDLFRNETIFANNTPSQSSLTSPRFTINGKRRGSRSSQGSENSQKEDVRSKVNMKNELEVISSDKQKEVDYLRSHLSPQIQHSSSDQSDKDNAAADQTLTVNDSSQSINSQVLNDAKATIISNAKRSSIANSQNDDANNNSRSINFDQDEDLIEEDNAVNELNKVPGSLAYRDRSLLFGANLSDISSFRATGFESQRRFLSQDRGDENLDGQSTWRSQLPTAKEGESVIGDGINVTDLPSTFRSRNDQSGSLLPLVKKRVQLQLNVYTPITNDTGSEQRQKSSSIPKFETKETIKSEGQQKKLQKTQRDDPDAKEQQLENLSLDLNESDNLDVMKYELNQVRKNVGKIAFQRGRGGSIPSTKGSRHRRIHLIIEKSLNQEYSSNPLRFLNYLFKLFIIFTFGFGIYQFVKGVHSIIAIENRSEAVKSSLFKVDAIIRINREFRLVQAAAEAFYLLPNQTYNSNILWVHSTALYQLQRLKEYNRNLIAGLEKMPESQRNQFFQKSVNFDGNLFNSFQASQILIEKGQIIKNTTYPSAGPYYDLNAKFIADHTLDDLLITAEEDSKRVINWLYQDIDSNQKELLAALIVFLIIICLTLAIFLSFASVLIKDEVKFVNALARTDFRDLTMMQYKLMQLEIALVKNMQEFTLMTFLEKADKDSRGIRIERDRKQNINMPILQKMNYRYWMIFLMVAPYLMLVSIWIVLNFFDIRKDINSSKGSQNQIIATLQFLAQNTVLNNEIIEIAFLNATTTLRNQPIFDVFLQDLEKSGSIVPLIDQLRKSDGSLTTLQNKILFGIKCNEIPIGNTDFITQDLFDFQCFDRSSFSGAVSISELSSQQDFALQHSLSLYNQLKDTDAGLKYLFVDGGSKYPQIMNIFRQLLSYLFVETDAEFKRISQSLYTRAIIQGSSLSIVSLAIGVLTAVCVMKKILSLEHERKYMLRMFAVRTILSNRFIKQYLIEHTKGFSSQLKQL